MTLRTSVISALHASVPQKWHGKAHLEAMRVWSSVDLLLPWSAGLYCAGGIRRGKLIAGDIKRTSSALRGSLWNPHCVRRPGARFQFRLRATGLQGLQWLLLMMACAPPLPTCVRLPPRCTSASAPITGLVKVRLLASGEAHASSSLCFGNAELQGLAGPCASCCLHMHVCACPHTGVAGPAQERQCGSSAKDRQHVMPP